MSSAANSLYQQKITRGLLFDPRTKILLLIELDILLFMGRSLTYESCVFLFCSLILLVGGQSRTALKAIVLFAVFVGVEFIIAPYLAIPAISFVHFIVVVVRKVIPVFILAKWVVTTTEVSAFVAAMWKIKMPKDAIVTTSVIFRCFPTLSEEWSAIQTAMKMRGIEFNLKHLLTKPGETLVHMIVPLFISALNISDELAAAALCRGLDNPETHTCLTDIHFRWCDILFLTVTSSGLIIMCVLMILRYSL